VLAISKPFLFYSYIQSSPVKGLAVIEERKHLRKIHMTHIVKMWYQFMKSYQALFYSFVTKHVVLHYTMIVELIVLFT
jgi:hypothetical protein